MCAHLQRTLLIGLTILLVNVVVAFQLGLARTSRIFVPPNTIDPQLHRLLGAPSSSSLSLSGPGKNETPTPTTLEEQGVIELATTATTTTIGSAKSSTSPPPATRQPEVFTFQSQGEIDPDVLQSVDIMSNPKQARVILYMILSLIPVLFLIPFMLGSRDLIPLDALPPVIL